MSQQPPEGTENYVLLRGLLAAEPHVRTLPSGDELCSFRLTVARSAQTHGRARADSIECASTRAPVRRTVTRCAPGQRLEVSGCLRRRFWRSAAGSPASRYEVEVIDVRRLRASSAGGDRSATRTTTQRRAGT